MRKWLNYEEEYLQNVINDTYKMFVTDVAKARKLDIAKYKNFAEAKIFTASQAKKVGLVDKVATVSYAKRRLQELALVKNPIWKKPDEFEKFMDKMISETVSKFSIYFSSTLKAY